MEKILEHALSIIEEKKSGLKCRIAREGTIVDLD